MKHHFEVKSCILTLLLACSLWGCSSTQEKAPFVDFADRSSWDPAKQQRWEAFQKKFIAHYHELPGSSRDGVSFGALQDPNQCDYDAIEQRRTRNRYATSCRKVFNNGGLLDESNCSDQQLMAELFQEEEENRGDQ